VVVVVDDMLIVGAYWPDGLMLIKRYMIRTNALRGEQDVAQTAHVPTSWLDFLRHCSPAPTPAAVNQASLACLWSH